MQGSSCWIGVGKGLYLIAIDNDLVVKLAAIACSEVCEPTEVDVLDFAGFFTKDQKARIFWHLDD